jgi:hypothetical protein
MSLGYLSNSWLLVSGLHAFEFGASCPQEKQVWLKAIGEAINTLQSDLDSHREEPQSMNQIPGELACFVVDRPVQSYFSKIKVSLISQPQRRNIDGGYLDEYEH